MPRMEETRSGDEDGLDADKLRWMSKGGGGDIRLLALAVVSRRSAELEGPCPRRAERDSEKICWLRRRSEPGVWLLLAVVLLLLAMASTRR